ncbi:hypothetical protein, partial [Klebsiella pneumoniae]|uniref:hypothetical protein n=1 Tax=Klebsiella pneumoniae TaxID=573 RepID=UPI001A90E99D
SFAVLALAGFRSSDEALLDEKPPSSGLGAKNNAYAVDAMDTAYALFFAPKPELGGFSSSNASSLDLNPAKANTAKLGDPVRE